MAVQIIDEPTFGGNLGRAVGTGVAGLLENLVQRKANELEQNKRAMGYEQNWGLDTQQAKMLAAQPLDFQQEVVKALVQSQQHSAIDRALHPEQQMMQNLGTMLQPQQGMQQPHSLEGIMNSMQGQQQQPQQDAITMALQKGLPQLLRQEQLGKAAPLPQRKQEVVPVVQQQQLQPKAPTGRSIQSVLQNKDLSPEMRLRVEALKQQRELAEKKISAADQTRINKETLPTYTKTNDIAHAARESDMRLNRIQELLDKGNVQDNVFIRSLDSLSHNKYLGDAFGAVKTIISNRDTQEFEKLSKDFLRDAKQFFGNRVTQGEVFTFLQTVPSLSQTNDGKRRVIRNMRIFNEGAKLRKQAMDQIIKENNGRRPEGLESLIEDRISGQLDALADKFREGATGALPTLGHTAKELITNLF